MFIADIITYKYDDMYHECRNDGDGYILVLSPWEPSSVIGAITLG